VTRSRTRIWFRRIALGAGALVLLILAAGAVFQAISEAFAKRRLAPPGGMVDVGGHRLHWHCMGEGSPTLVLQSGGGDVLPTWYRIHGELAHTTRVCAYDRAGYRWSERGPRPRTGQQIASELLALLDSTGTSEPVVILGYSYGGQLAVEFALLHPERVAGLVLVDAAVPDAMDRVPAEWNRAARTSAGRFATRAALRTGLWRLMWNEAGIPPDLTGEERLAAKAFLPQTIRNAMIEAEDGMMRYRFPVAPGILGELPVRVLSAASWFDIPNAPGPPPPWAPEFDAAWNAIQAEVAALSHNAEHVRLEGTGHGIPWAAPEAVVEAAESVVQKVRSGGESADSRDTMPLARAGI
jgi:pimeloyl-ACP methyl ester carboxylesterase